MRPVNIRNQARVTSWEGWEWWSVEVVRFRINSAFCHVCQDALRSCWFCSAPMLRDTKHTDSDENDALRHITQRPGRSYRNHTCPDQQTPCVYYQNKSHIK